MLAHASCKPTEQAVNTFYLFLPLFFNMLFSLFLPLFFNTLFSSTEILSPLQRCITLTRRGPAGGGRGGTACCDSRCSASFSHQSYSTAMFSQHPASNASTTAHTRRCSFRWNQPLSCFCRIFHEDCLCAHTCRFTHLSVTKSREMCFSTCQI